MAADSFMSIIWILLGFINPFGVLDSSRPPGPVGPADKIDCMEASFKLACLVVIIGSKIS